MTEPGEPDPRIIEAVEWYSAFRGTRERPAIPLLKERFSTSAARGRHDAP